MLPLRLEIKNFLPYRAPDPLRFDGIHLACLTGHNGAGKSALLDAITWALWGKARARDTDLIHLGQTDMLVQFDFEHEGAVYRVVRRRSRRGGASGTGSVELFVRTQDGGWETRTEPSARATQEAVNRLLRLDYDTFVHSAFLQQGKADAFTTKSPAERKQILGEILGLAQWEDYEERVKAALKAIADELNLIRGGILQIDRDLQREPALRADLERARAAHTDALEVLAHAEARLAEVASAPLELQTARDRKADSERRIRDYQRDLNALEVEITRWQARIAEDERDIADQQTIEEGYHTLQTARNADSALGDKLRQLRELDEHHRALERQVDEERARLETEVGGYEATIAGFERTIALADPNELGVIQDELNALQELADQRDSLTDTIPELEATQGALKAENTALTAQGKEIGDRIKRLETAEGAVCPLCGQPLTEDHRLRLIADLNTDLETMREGYRLNQQQTAAIKAEITELREQISLLAVDLKRQRPLMEKAGKLQAEYDAARSAAAALTDAQNTLTAIREALEHGDYAHDARRDLATLEAQRAALGYDADAHRSAGEQIQVYREYEIRYQRLQVALNSLPGARAALEGCLLRRDNVLRARGEEQAAVDALDGDIARLQVLAEEYNARLQEVKTQRTAEAKVRDRMTAAEQDLKALDDQRRRRAELEERRAQKTYEEGLYEELRLAFGRNGIPAMIIETVIPELEETANALLARMTDGRMALRLRTQREKVTGGTAETLDIEIADELGTRAYDLYSGGEAFRINFALRVALSQLLARRAGAHLQTLFIDEGFGTQDDDGRNKLVEAINAVQHEFDMILIITHMEDLRDSFPVHIVVEKTPHGSRVSVR